MKKTKIVTVVGARPQFIKAAVLSRAIRGPWSDRVDELVIHTGQHYDTNMSEVFFQEMAIPEPTLRLTVGGKSHGQMTGEMLGLLESAYLEHRPDLVLVYGDTNSTLAGALAASKLLIPVAHVEAGLRSFHKAMPEEQNRIVTDHLSTWLLCPTQTAVGHLADEGIRSQVYLTGDIMLDASLYYRELAARRRPEERLLPKLGVRRPFRLLTIHRAENTDQPDRLRSILEAVNEADDMDVVFPVHPRTKKYLDQTGWNWAKHVHAIEPVGFFDMLDLVASCEQVVTDSGGVQKEAYFFQKPCVTLRDQTEWVETVEAGWNRLVGANRQTILQALGEAQKPQSWPPLYGNGTAADEILRSILGGLG